MKNILNVTEAANVLRCDTDDPLMLQLLPQVDAYIRNTTGRDWSADTAIDNDAKSAAMMLITIWHENPSQLGSQTTDFPLSFGLGAMLTLLEAKALQYRQYSFNGVDGGGNICLGDTALEGDQVVALVGITGVSGDQSTNFESVLADDYYIEQTSTSDLSDNQYLLTLRSAVDVARGAA